MKAWHEKAEQVALSNSTFDLHIQMVSTITEATEVYSGQKTKHSHKDEIWIWHAPTELGKEHAITFVHSLQDSPKMETNTVEMEFLQGERSILLPKAKLIEKKSSLDLPIVIIHIDAGSMNSRKSDISPYLPRQD